MEDQLNDINRISGTKSPSPPPLLSVHTSPLPQHDSTNVSIIRTVPQHDSTSNGTSILAPQHDSTSEYISTPASKHDSITGGILRSSPQHDSTTVSILRPATQHNSTTESILRPPPQHNSTTVCNSTTAPQPKPQLSPSKSRINRVRARPPKLESRSKSVGAETREEDRGAMEIDR